MTDGIQRSAYWLFTENQLTAALDEYFRGNNADARSAIEKFLKSELLVERGMREGDLGKGLIDDQGNCDA